MKKPVEYEKQTRLAYRDTERAQKYRAQHMEDISWVRFTMWREQRLVGRILQQCRLQPNDIIFDMPCGTGLLSAILRDQSCSVFAADISREMMEQAQEDFCFEKFGGFIQADMTHLPLPTDLATCVITVGLMHRLPEDIRRSILREIVSLSSRYLIISYSVDSLFQRFKRKLVYSIRPRHSFAPSPVPLAVLRKEFREAGVEVKAQFFPFPLLCADVIFFLEKIH